MRTFILQCGNCGGLGAARLTDASVEWKCRSCAAPARIDVFPALLRGPATGRSGEKLLVPEESSCYYHPDKKAVVVCDSCGRFLCAVCDLEFGRRHVCPRCIESAVSKDKSQRLRLSRIYYDEIALALAAIPMLFFWITLFTAPAAIYVAVRYSRRRLSILPRRKWRFLLAIALAALQLMGWILAVSYFFVSGIE